LIYFLKGVSGCASSFDKTAHLGRILLSGMRFETGRGIDTDGTPHFVGFGDIAGVETASDDNRLPEARSELPIEGLSRAAVQRGFGVEHDRFSHQGFGWISGARGQRAPGTMRNG